MDGTEYSEATGLGDPEFMNPTTAFLAAIILIGLGSAAVWGTIVGAVLISA
jgi:hypothetical protein